MSPGGSSSTSGSGTGNGAGGGEGSEQSSLSSGSLERLSFGSKERKGSTQSMPSSSSFENIAQPRPPRLSVERPSQSALELGARFVVLFFFFLFFLP